MAILQLIRFPNLLIVGLTQGLLYAYVVRPPLIQNGISPQLTSFQMAIYIGVTIALTASGYIINDILDIPVDRINKPDKMIVTRRISLQSARWLYLCIGIGGFLMATYLGLSVDRSPLIGLYPLAFGLLYAYSARIKNTPLLGNLLIALFCAGVAGTIWLAEYQSLTALRNLNALASDPAIFLMVWYMVFAFFSNLFREIIKDLEDADGDRQVGGRTAPIAWGIPTSKWIAGSTGIALAVILIFQSQQVFSYFPAWVTYFLWGGLIIPLGGGVLLLAFAKNKRDYHRMSTLTKIIMLNGILLLFFANV